MQVRGTSSGLTPVVCNTEAEANMCRSKLFLQVSLLQPNSCRRSKLATPTCLVFDFQKQEGDTNLPHSLRVQTITVSSGVTAHLVRVASCRTRCLCTGLWKHIVTCKKQEEGVLEGTKRYEKAIAVYKNGGDLSKAGLPQEERGGRDTHRVC